jgi:hypothetical protein
VPIGNSGIQRDYACLIGQPTLANTANGKIRFRMLCHGFNGVECAAAAFL